MKKKNKLPLSIIIDKVQFSLLERTSSCKFKKKITAIYVSIEISFKSFK